MAGAEVIHGLGENVNPASMQIRITDQVERASRITLAMLQDGQDGLDDSRLEQITDVFAPLEARMEADAALLAELGKFAYDAVREFFDKKLGLAFSAAELRAHLDEQGVAAPPQERLFGTFLQDWADEFMADRLQDGRSVLFVQCPVEKGTEPLFALVETAAPIPVTVPCIRQPDTAGKPEAPSENPAAPEEGEVATVVFMNAFRGARRQPHPMPHGA